MSGKRDEDLAERISDLEEELRSLQTELRRDRRAVPRPPRPTDLLLFAESHAIPTTIAFLEAHIRALKLLQGLIRVSGIEEEGRARNTKSRQVTQAAVQRLEALLDDLRTTPLPEESDANRILEEAEDLRAELVQSMEASEETDEGDEGMEIQIDVDEELDAIKSDLQEDGDQEDGDQSTGENR